MILSVLYPDGPDKHFDKAYYREKHIPLVRKLCAGFGLRDVRVLHGTNSAPFHTIGLLEFDTLSNFNRALEAHGAEIMADIPKFTDIEPVLQTNELDD